MIHAGILIVASIPILLVVGIHGYRRGVDGQLLVVRLAVVVWVLAVIAATLFPLPYQRELLASERADQFLTNNFTPMATIGPAVAGGVSRQLAQVLANVAMFVPLGFLLPMLVNPCGWGRAVSVAIGASIAIEVSQFTISWLLGYTYKITDVDDVILNVTGALLGYGLFRVLSGRVVDRPREPDSTVDLRTQGPA